jgi:predicted nuclease of restriction endonuclease-like RecB superfamily
MAMCADANLESKTAQALRHYREALAKVDDLEREEASAHQALIKMLLDFERAIFEDRAPSVRQKLFETGAAVVTRSDEAWYALNEATATLEVARQALTALAQ